MDRVKEDDLEIVRDTEDEMLSEEDVVRDDGVKSEGDVVRAKEDVARGGDDVVVEEDGITNEATEVSE